MKLLIIILLSILLVSLLIFDILIIRKLDQNENIQLTRYMYICKSLQNVETKILETLINKFKGE